jgi:hypothetical protein
MRHLLIIACAAWVTLFGTLPGKADKRVALVIGNGAYQNTAGLTNPLNDATDIATALKAVGFDVLIERNVNKRSLENAMARFARLSQDADAVLFYYAGHGMQYRGLNYLMPVDARLEDEFSVNSELTRIDDLLFALSGARGVKILILDACRDNPLADRLSLRTVNRDFVGTRGLARIEAPRGVIIAYATQSNQVAVDGIGRNSPFTAALLKEIGQPGLEIAALFRRVAANVDRATGGKQLPELSISMSGEFYLNTHETDAQAWVRVRQSSNINELQEFVHQYPDSFLVADAQARLAALERQQAEQELAERQRFERVERQRLESQREEQERAAREAAERFAKAEEERARREQAEREKETTELERVARETEERERLERERIEREHSQRENTATQSGPIGSIVILSPPSETKPAAPAEPARPAGEALTRQIKVELKRVGCYAGQVDDRWSNGKANDAVRRFAKYAKLPGVSDEPTVDLLRTIQGKSDRVCPLECDSGKIEKNGRCIARSCPPGSSRSANGNCLERSEDARTGAAGGSAPAHCDANCQAKCDRSWRNNSANASPQDCYARWNKINAMPDGQAKAIAECGSVCRAKCDATWQKDSTYRGPQDCYAHWGPINARSRL